MSKHTPGPWVPHEWRVFAAGEHGNLICDCAEDRDARLIAAAPEMLEALRPLANYLAILETMGGPSGGKGMNGDDHLWHVSSSAGDAVITFGDLQRARAAIAKAEGRL